MVLRMFTLLVLVVFVLFVGVGLFINVYLYRHHALRTAHRRVLIDDQLFAHYADVDIAEVW